MAVALKTSLEKLGFKVLIQIESEWYTWRSDHYGTAIVFRGLHRYQPKPHQINILWNISHPDKVSLDEYESYDYVFIASQLWADHIASQVSTPVEVMFQCSDPKRFHPPSAYEQEKYRHQLLFVGNSRDIYRKILQDLLPTKYDLAVYGKNWTGIIPRKHIKKKLIKNNKLYRYYGSADILLNDHWDDMRDKGFVSNRIFDALACGAFVISDNVAGMESSFAQYLQTYKDKKGLYELIDFYLQHPEERKKKVSGSVDFIKNYHTFDIRAEQFARVIAKLLKKRSG